MATTTFTLGIKSNISSDTVNMSVSFNATTNGTTGFEETSGIARTTVTTSLAKLIDISAAPIDLTDTKAILYLKNTSSTHSNYIDITIGNTAGTYITALRVNGGEFALLPVANLTDADGAGTDADINVQAATGDAVLEYGLFYTK